MTAPVLEMDVGALLDILDEDIRHVQTVLQRLDQLRSLLIKRDDAGLEELLAELALRSEAHAANEQKRQDLRREFAAHLACPIEQVTLSRLARLAPAAQRNDISERQKMLKSLIDRLRGEHALTTRLLADCSRFNQSLLRLFLGQSGRGAVSYGANGAPVRRADATLMSLHF
jgi:flagellar biosynthesis/type III secretory pathway chaperone